MDDKKEAIVRSDNDSLVKALLRLPRDILHHYDVEGLAPLVLHAVGHELGLKRASYLIDNPDFDCLKGIAGYCQHECSLHKPDLWNDPHAFFHDMDAAPFHKKMQQFSHNSFKRNKENYLQDLNALGKDLGIDHPDVMVWNLRNDNHGVLIFEEGADQPKKDQQLLESVVALLGLCPIKA